MEKGTGSRLLAANPGHVRLDRRRFMLGLAGGVGASLLGTLLAACGGSTSSSSGTTAATSTTQASESQAMNPASPATAGGSAEIVPGKGGTLIVDLASEPENLDPHQTLAYTTNLLVEQITEGLVWLKPGSVETAPLLATSWETSKDGKTWTFKLRDGMKFHDGTICDADAVKFSFDRQLVKSNPYYSQGSWSSAPLFTMVSAVKAVDKATVQFTLSEFDRGFIFHLNGGGGAIVSPAGVKKYGKTFLENPVGTGPYKFNRWDKGQQVVLDRFDDYWDGTPGLDQVVFKAITEDGARLASLLTNAVHVAVDVSPQIYTRMKSSKDHHVVVAPTGSIWFLAMNVKYAPFADPKVRQAINYAVNKSSIVNDVLKGTADIAYGPLGAVWADFNPAVKEMYGYDPGKASQLLKDVNFSIKTPVVFRTSIQGSGMLQPAQMAAIIQDNLRQIGINTKLVTQEFVAWMDAIRNPQNELTVMSWNGAPVDPVQFLAGFLSKSAFPPGFNTSYWEDPDFEQALDTARTSLDANAAHQALLKAQQIVMDAVPIVPVCHAKQIFAVSNTVQNFRAVPGMDLLLRHVWIKQ